MVVPVNYFLALSVALFTLGVIGVIIRRNAIVIFMCIEMMLNSVNLAFIAFADYFKAVDGQMFDVGGRQVLIPVTAAWSVFMLIPPVATAVRHIQSFIASQGAGDYV